MEMSHQVKWMEVALGYSHTAGHVNHGAMFGNNTLYLQILPFKILQKHASAMDFVVPFSCSCPDGVIR